MWEPSTSYTPEQNGKAKHLIDTLIFFVCLILLAIYLPKIIWDELIKTVTYLKNSSPGINSITPYKFGYYIHPNLSNLKVVRSRV